MNTTDSIVGSWPDDVLNRKQFAEFLTQSLSEEARLRAKKEAGLTVALDADWGTGKTFFVRHWAEDIRELGFPVVFFDAWENDIGDEASIALMAGIKEELHKWMAHLPKTRAIRHQAAEATKEAIKGLRRAIIPASRVIVTSVLKKTTGIVADEVIDAISKDSDGLSDDLSQATTATLEAGLDELFKRALEDHQRRSTAIVAFKTAIGELIEILELKAGAKMPVFVFVDEVDRCRPPYAIKLLEEIKHIFGTKKVCFVVSTNLEQLSESVRAIYGVGFDGNRYLKRFFDYQYTLPEPDSDSFTAQLLSEHGAIASRAGVSGLPRQTGDEKKRAISLVARSFDLDLRSQKQVFLMASAVAAAIPPDRRIFVLWLFFLCALRHRHPHLFDKLTKTRLDSKAFLELCGEAFQQDLAIEYKVQPNPIEHPTTKYAKLSEIIRQYYEWSTDDLMSLRDRFYNGSSQTYPFSNLVPVIEEMPSTFYPGTRYIPSIASYVRWVKYAGLGQQ